MILSKFEPWGAIHEAFWKASSEVSQLKVALEKARENLLQNKTVPGFKRG